ncbi:hypothetical protein MTO96_016675 [Rhipicephalus appendiculatus]
MSPSDTQRPRQVRGEDEEGRGGSTVMNPPKGVRTGEQDFRSCNRHAISTQREPFKIGSFRAASVVREDPTDGKSPNYIPLPQGSRTAAFTVATGCRRQCRGYEPVNSAH